METLGELVARLREERGLTQAQLADRSGVDVVTIARVEQNRGPGWWRKTARAVFRALASHTPIHDLDAQKYFQLTKYNPKDDEVQRAIAEGEISVGESHRSLKPIPSDLTDLLSKMLYSFGEARTRALMRTVLSLAINSEPATDEPRSAQMKTTGSLPTQLPPPPAGSIAVDSPDTPGLRKYIPTSSSEPRVPGQKPRRRKSG